MLCCGGQEEEIYNPPPNQSTAPPKIGSYAGGKGGDRGEPRTSNARSGAPRKNLLIKVPSTPLNDLHRQTSNFGTKALIGEGSYGCVFYRKLSDVQEAAIKRLDNNSSPEPNSDFEEQLSTISRLKNEHFVRLIGYCLESNELILVYEYASMCSLHDVLHGKKGLQGAEPGQVLTLNQRVKIAYGATRGLEFLHENLLDNIPQELGTFGYHAPDFGVVLLELLMGRKPVDHTMPKGKQSLVTWATPRLSEDKVKHYVDPKLNDD